MEHIQAAIGKLGVLPAWSPHPQPCLFLDSFINLKVFPNLNDSMICSWLQNQDLPEEAGKILPQISVSLFR